MDFSGNAITAAGIEAFDGILQINTALKTLNLSGNIIGDEGAKVFSTLSIYHPCLPFCSVVCLLYTMQIIYYVLILCSEIVE